MGRDGKGPTSPTDVMYLAQQTHTVLHMLMDRSIQLLKNVDRVAGEMAKEIHEREQRLEELRQAEYWAAGEANERGSASGAPAETVVPATHID